MIQHWRRPEVSLGLLGPAMVGILKCSNGGKDAQMTALGIALVVAGLAVLALGQRRGKAP